MKLTEQERTVLRGLAQLWRERRFVLIGAAALGCHLPMDWRRTHDLDILLAVDLDDYPAGLDSTSGWERDRRLEHRWLYRGLPIDILLAGDQALAQGSITWPGTGQTMSLAGADLAMEHTSSVPCGSNIEIEVATLPVIVLLKMAAFCDRPFERERDLTDIGHIFEQYLEQDHRCFGEAALEAQVDFEHVNAFLCGQDVGAIIRTEAHERLIQQFLDLVAQGSTHFYLWLRLGPLHEEEALVSRMAAFHLGLTRSGRWPL